MEEQIRVSVCMATYNGEAYIMEQLLSILPQLSDSDEIVIVDDHSHDRTVAILNSFNDDRIHIYVNEQNLGVNRSFEKAIGIARGKYIFMSDQDDVWTDGRLSAMLEPLQNGKGMLVSGNTEAIDSDGNVSDYSLGKLNEADESRYKSNIRRIFMGTARYYGCAMAFSAELKKVILPFPTYLESHDLWIAMAANLMKSNVHLEQIVLRRRIHGHNASVVTRSLYKKLRSRVIFAKSYRALKRNKRNLQHANQD